MESLSEEEGQLMLEDILPDVGNLPDRELLGEVIWSRLEEMLVSMPPSQRQVFVWHEFEQKSFKEMASISGETVNTLISRKRYAILALREGLAELYNDLINDYNNEKILVWKNSCDDPHLFRHSKWPGDDALELANARTFWADHHYLLAGSRTASLIQNYFWV